MLYMAKACAYSCQHCLEACWHRWIRWNVSVRLIHYWPTAVTQSRYIQYSATTEGRKHTKV